MQKTENTPAEHGFAASGFTDDTHRFAVSYRNRHVVGGADNLFSLPEFYDQVFDFQDRRRNLIYVLSSLSGYFCHGRF